MPRSDKGIKRTNYNQRLDNTGKTGKENIPINAFWKTNTVAEFMALTKEEADKKIEEWMAEFEIRNLKRNKLWWYPEAKYDSNPKAKVKKKNNNFNPSIRRD